MFINERKGSDALVLEEFRLKLVFLLNVRLSQRNGKPSQRSR